MNSVIVNMILSGLSSTVIKEVFLALAQHYVEKTTNTFDDELLKAVKKALEDEGK